MNLPNDAILHDIFKLETIAVIGCSTNPTKAAHNIPKYMYEQGYNVIPVNPHTTENIFGQVTYGSLADVPVKIDMVNVFRPSSEMPTVINTILGRNDSNILWMQLGISHPEAVKLAESNGRVVIQDECLMVEHRRIKGV